MYLYLVKILEDNYPEMLKRLYVVNGKPENSCFQINSLVRPTFVLENFKVYEMYMMSLDPL